RTLPGPRYTIHLIDRPRSTRALFTATDVLLTLVDRGFGMPSSFAVTVSVRVLGRVTASAELPVMLGGSLPGSRTPPPLFSEKTSSFNSHSGCNHPLA